MGTVIISAAIILGGTFAAMYPSGVLSLLQMATIIFICAHRFAAIHSGDGKNKWPFMKEERVWMPALL
ncbi:hypothetical protein HNQ34_001744 [Anoxybacillus tepidamans]|uniref:Uncharacterized protein n=1 Tax=Anoxybacteroides tepidamans TaxID=265948 RepID=A0A7W8IQC4_9BACL|nr:hypothetical protein [Anoxybacillus tepidamans]MBB5324647.1 hypothetical protein [Anoxybacillus tepidamans]